jgi:nucleotide-binding universal stress UspA family protein
MPADGKLLPRVEDHVGRVRPGQHDHRPRAEQRGDLRAGIHPRAVLGDHVEVDVGQLVPGAGADRAEHRDRADPVVAGVVRHHVRDERLVGGAAERLVHGTDSVYPDAVSGRCACS